MVLLKTKQPIISLIQFSDNIMDREMEKKGSISIDIRDITFKEQMISEVTNQVIQDNVIV